MSIFSIGLLLIKNTNGISGSSSFGRAVAFQASGGRFEPGLPLILNLTGLSRRSSGVEHFLGREGVVSSILTDGSIRYLNELLV